MTAAQSLKDYPLSIGYLRAMLIGAAAIALAACGGGGGGVGSTPFVPTPLPPPEPVIVPQATASQEFAVLGATFRETAFPEYEGPLLGADDQLRIRYDADHNAYEILEPSTSEWMKLTPYGSEWTTNIGFGPETRVQQIQGGPMSDYSYSGLAYWYDVALVAGTVAFGQATPQAAIPLSGSATYDGSVYGTTTETYDWYDWGRGQASVTGSISLAFDFGAGNLSGSLSPKIYANSEYSLDTLSFTDTVYSVGSTAFSGRFETSLAGDNSFSGLFTGPDASELIGNFAFPYISALDGKQYEAGGAFVAKH